MKSYDILIVEDDAALCEALCETLKLEGYVVSHAANGTEALLKLSKASFKLVISDVQMPVMDGIQLLSHINENYREIPVLLMTAYGTVPKAVEAIQSGAVDYLVKPFDGGELALRVAHLLVKSKATQKESKVVVAPIMKKLYELAEKVAVTDVTVLIQGPSGAGKEVLAQFVHNKSLFKQGEFVAINCAAIPENMLEAILFGYEKGAFTGATQAMPGKFELAQGGTLLLDEVSEMDINLQAKLLRVIQEKEVERLGSQRKIKLNVRILATTNRKLKSYVEEGLFREDLYYRLNVFPLVLPMLADRKEDILPLAKDLLAAYVPDNRKLPVFTAEAEGRLQAYSWPGNVRELENVMRRALIYQAGECITEQDLVFEVDNNVEVVLESSLESPFVQAEIIAPDASLGSGLLAAEDKIILHTLEKLNGARQLTADALQISDRTLRHKIAKMKERGVIVP